MYMRPQSHPSSPNQRPTPGPFHTTHTGTTLSTRVTYMNGSVKEPNMFHNYETDRSASDAAENLQLYRVVLFFHPRSS